MPQVVSSQNHAGRPSEMDDVTSRREATNEVSRSWTRLRLLTNGSIVFISLLLISGCGKESKNDIKSPVSSPKTDVARVNEPSLASISRKNEKQIALDTIYTSYEQGNTKYIKDIKDIKVQIVFDVLQILNEETDRSGLTQLFLVRGSSFVDALKSSANAFKSSQSGLEPIWNPDCREINEYWAFVFLGLNGSSPPAYKLTEVTSIEKRVVIKYQTIDSYRTHDSSSYFIWIPLKRIDEGKWQIELHCVDDGTIVISRTVHVKHARE